MQVKTIIADKLKAAFVPQSLDIEDESYKHAGHAGHRPGGDEAHVDQRHRVEPGGGGAQVVVDDDDEEDG